MGPQISGDRVGHSKGQILVPVVGDGSGVGDCHREKAVLCPLAAGKIPGHLPGGGEPLGAIQSGKGQYRAGVGEKDGLPGGGVTADPRSAAVPAYSGQKGKEPRHQGKTGGQRHPAVPEGLFFPGSFGAGGFGHHGIRHPANG